MLKWILLGFQVTKYNLQELQQRMGLQHRVWGTDALHNANANLQTAITAELDSGMPTQYGWEYMGRNLSIRGIPVARDRMSAIKQGLDPEAVAARKPAFKAGRDRVGKYLVPGPDYVWSVNGHLKFRDYRIGIYRCIDGYSRYITSTHVGLSVTCAVSIMKLYLDALSGNDNIRQTIIRADCGTDTMLMSNAQWQIEQADNAEALCSSAFRYGTSKSNSRIEGWWNELTKGQTREWQIYIHNKRTSPPSGIHSKCAT
jgi:hypothetical protein